MSMPPRDPNSMPIGSHHLGKLLAELQELRARVAKLENTTPAYVEFAEVTEPAAGPTNRARLFAVDNGAGKTSLRVRFATGASITLATEV